MPRSKYLTDMADTILGKDIGTCQKYHFRILRKLKKYPKFIVTRHKLLFSHFNTKSSSSKISPRLAAVASKLIQTDGPLLRR